MPRVLSWLFFGFAAATLATSCADQENPSSGKPPTTSDDDGGIDDGDDDDGSIDDAGASDASDDPDAPPISVTGDPKNGILLEGTVLGPDGPYEGQVLTLPDGTIGCAAPGQTCAADPRAAEAAHADVQGIVAPGLIDTHNHILFDIFDGSDWLPQRLYTNHDDWTKNANEPRYTVMVDVKQCLENASQGKPSWCPSHFDKTGNLKCEMEKWGEIKALIAGTTSVVGLAGTALPCFDSLARSIDTKFNGLDADKVQTAAITPSKTTADGVCKNYENGKTAAYLIHVGEGLDDKARAEFGKLGTMTTTPECLYAPGTAVTHGTAFTAQEFATMKAHDMKLTWSPASNIALYGDTTNIPAALDAGLVVSLAPDWSMGGSQNMLDELSFAKNWSDTKWAGRLSAKDVVTMATANAATVLALGDKIGTIQEGMQADLFVVEGDAAARKVPYDTVVAAKPKQVRLTMVAGKVLYGDANASALSLDPPSCETFDACGRAKFLCVADPSRTTDKLDQTYAQIHDALEAAMQEIDTVRPANIGGNFSPVAPAVACK